MKKIILFLSFSFLFIASKAQVLYGDKMLDKAGTIFSFTNETPRPSWDFDCTSCQNSCSKDFWKFYGPTAASPAGLTTQNVVTQFGYIYLFQVDPSASVVGDYPWKHIGRKHASGSFFCTECFCYVDNLQPFVIYVRDFTWKNTVSNLQYICKSTATPIDLKTYLNFYDPAVTIVGPGISSGGILNVSGLTPGTYTVTATRGFDNFPSKQISFSFTVVDFSPTIQSPSQLTVCQGTPLQLTANPQSDSYIWYLNGAVINGANGQNYNVTQTGNYSVELTQNGCSKTTTSVLATVNPAPVMTTSPSGNISLCTGGTITLTSSPATTYLWSNGSTSNSIVVNASGSYSVTGTNSFGCFATSPTVNISDAGNSPATIAILGNTDLCLGDATLLTANLGDSYQWFKNGSQLPDITQSITVTSAGNYYVKVTTGTCVSTSTNVTITVKPAATPTISSNQSNVVCEGTTVTLTSSPAVSYLWSNGATQSTTSPITTGAYNVTVTYANGCSKVSPDYVQTFLPNPQPIITPSGSLTFCNGGNVTLVSSNGNTYQWFLNGVTISGAIGQSYVATTSGSYTVKTKTLANCERTSDPVTVVVNPTPNVVISTNGISCNSSPVTLSAATVPALSNLIYLWNTGSTSNQITTTTTGLYTCTITDQNGCFNTGNYNLTSTSLQPPVISTNGPTTFCSGGIVTLSSSYATGNTWSTGETSPSIQVSAPGIYTVIVSNGICSATSSSVTVTVHPIPDASITILGNTDWCQGDPGAVLTANLENSYLWSNGATTRSITPTTSGTYFVTTKNVFNCTATSPSVQVTVKPNPVPTITVTGSTTFCTGQSVTLTASSGVSYLWSNGATTQTLIATTAGSYSVTVTTANGCTNTSLPVNVTVIATPIPTITTPGSTTFCEGSSIVLTSSTASSYQWYINGAAIAGATGQSYTATLAGNYTVVTSSANGCLTSSVATTVTTNPRPNVVISTSGISCNSSPVTLSAATVPALSNLTYLWNTGATASQITTITTGLYSCTITDQNGCFNVGTYNLTSTSLQPPVISTNGPTTFCSGGIVTLSSSYATGNVWSTGETSASIQVSQPGIYSVTVSNGICTATSTTVTITVHPIPDASITITGNTQWCQGDPGAVLTANLENSYLWSNGATTRSITPTVSGTYFVTTKNVYNCTATSAGYLINILSAPTPTISIIGNTTLCNGDSVILTSSFASSYLWSNGATSQSITVFSAGDYSVNVTSPNGCLKSSNPVHITVLPSTPASITAGGPTTFCTGGSVLLSANFGSAYLWNNGATTQNITVSQSGTYTCTVTSLNGCVSTSAPVQTIMKSNPSVSISGGTVVGCSGSAVTLTAVSASPNLTYLWSNGVNTQTNAVSTPGPFTVTVYDQYGCFGTSAPVSLTFSGIAPPTITADGPTIFCPGDSVILTSSLANSYQWSNGAVTRSITVTTAGTYTVNVFNSIGCTNVSAPVVVSLHAAEVPTIEVLGSTSICNGDSVVLRSSIASGYQWLPFGGNTQEITVFNAGVYRVKTTSQYGCTNTSAPIQITVRPVIIPTITGSPATLEACFGDTVRLVSSSGVGYTWSNGQTGQTCYVTTTGNYYVTTQNANGCFGRSNTVSVLIKDNPQPIITPNRPLYLCDTPALRLESSLAVAYLWNTGATTRTITPTVVGNYWVKATNPNGCVSKSEIITVQQGIGVFLSPITQKKICVDAGVQTLTYGNPVGGYYTGPGITNLNEFDPLLAGVGTHTIAYNFVSATGCLTFVNFTMQVKPKVIWNVKPDTSICLGGGLYDLYNISMPINNTTYAGPGVSGRFFNPLVAGVGVHPISITVNDSIGCIETKTMNITVFENPAKPIITGQLFGCIGDTLTLSASSNNSNAYAWYYLGNPVSFATGQTISVPLLTNRKIYVKAFNVSPAGVVVCSSPSSDTLDLVTKNPTGNFNADFTTIPWGGLVHFNTNIVNGNQYYWTFGDSSYSAQQNPGHYYYTPGLKTVVLRVTSPEGCILNLTKLQYISVGPKPIDTSTIALPIYPIDDKNPFKINLFPNPYDEHLYITFSLLNPTDKITVIAYTQKGEKVAEETIKGLKGNNKVELKNFKNLTTQVFYVFKVQVLNSILYFKQVRIKE